MLLRTGTDDSWLLKAWEGKLLRNITTKAPPAICVATGVFDMNNLLRNHHMIKSVNFFAVTHHYQA